jgi:hypothetical protein
MDQIALDNPGIRCQASRTFGLPFSLNREVSPMLLLRGLGLDVF